MRYRSLSVSAAAADSVALAIALAMLRSSEPHNRLILAYFDHGVRSTGPQEADFVAALAQRLGCDFATGAAPSTIGNEQPSQAAPSEETLRHWRTDFFTRLLKQSGARYLCLAHHRDDQVETIAQRIFRGTGLQGLQGMQTFRPWDVDWVCVRPLLTITRAELREFLREQQAAFLEDPTNAQSHWCRNWIRNELLPQLEARFPDPTSALLRLSEQATDSLAAIKAWADHLGHQCIEAHPLGFRIDLTKLRTVIDAFHGSLPKLVIQEMLRTAWTNQAWPLNEMSADKWQQLSQGLMESLQPMPAAATRGPSIDLGTYPGNVRVSVSGVHWQATTSTPTA